MFHYSILQYLAMPNRSSLVLRTASWLCFLLFIFSRFSEYGKDKQLFTNKTDVKEKI